MVLPKQQTHRTVLQQKHWFHAHCMLFVKHGAMLQNKSHYSDCMTFVCPEKKKVENFSAFFQDDFPIFNCTHGPVCNHGGAHGGGGEMGGRRGVVCVCVCHWEAQWKFWKLASANDETVHCMRCKSFRFPFHIQLLSIFSFFAETLLSCCAWKVVWKGPWESPFTGVL